MPVSHRVESGYDAFNVAFMNVIINILQKGVTNEMYEHSSYEST